MKKALILTALFLCCLFLIAEAQQKNNQSLPQYLKEDHQKEGWLVFQENSPISSQSLTQDQGQKWTYLGLRPVDELLWQSSYTDLLGFSHNKYQQTYKNIPIEGAELLVHAYKDQVRQVNGKLLTDLELNTVPNISEQAALKKALGHVNAEVYAWEDAQVEQTLKHTEKDSCATYYPTGELVIVDEYLGQGAIKTNYRLAYRFDIFALKPMQRYHIYVDAQDGTILNTIAQFCRFNDTSCTGHGGYGLCDQKEGLAITAQEQESRYYLEQESRGIVVYNALNETHFPLVSFTSTSPYFDQDPVAVNAYWAMEQFYDYFLKVHQRNSIDGQGAKLRAWVHYGEKYNNALWTGNWIALGDGDSIKYLPLSSLDIVVHELTHGLTQNTANLVYAYESGALNESFSDIFATVIEYYVAKELFADPSCANWYIGEQVMPNHLHGSRSMSNPSSNEADIRQPKSYQGAFWWKEAGDAGGIHTNSGVQNYWFYLLSEGGSVVSEEINFYEVEGIGIEKAAAITYRNLTTYLTKTAQYSDARAGSIQAAIDLYGKDSKEVKQVITAWCAVGLGDEDCTSQQVDAQIQLSSHQEKTTFQFGDDTNIQWETLGTYPVERVDIDYSVNGGASWSSIAADIPNNGSFEWTVPDINTSLAIIRVSDATIPHIKGESASFTINTCTHTAHFLLPKTTYCIGETINLKNTSLTTNDLTCEWWMNGELLGTGDQLTLDLEDKDKGESTLILRTKDNNCVCRDEYSQLISIQPAPDPTFTYAKYYANLIVHANFNQARTYEWDFGDGQKASGNIEQEHKYDVQGIYNVCLSITDDCSTAQSCQEITIGEDKTCYNTEAWRVFPHKKGITEILYDGDWVWVALDNGELRKVNHTTGVQEVLSQFSELLRGEMINQIVKDRQNNIWIATTIGLIKFHETDIDQWQLFNASNSELVYNNIRYVLEDYQGMIWVAVYGSLHQFDGVSTTGWMVFNQDNSELPNPYIEVLFEDSQNRLWMGTRGGLVLLNGNDRGRWMIYNQDNYPLPNNEIRKIVEDQEGVIWLGTTDGLARFDFDQEEWQVFNSGGELLKEGTINNLAVNAQNQICLSTTNYLIQIEGENINNWTIQSTQNAIFSNWMMDNNGIVWMGNSFGELIQWHSSNRWEVLDLTPHGLPYAKINDLLVDRYNNLFVATFAGLTLIKDEQYKHWTFFNSPLTDNDIRVLFEDQLGNIWIGTDDALIQFSENIAEWQIYKAGENGIPKTHINALAEDQDGNIWLGTGEGLVKFDGQQFIHWTVDNSLLPDNHINTLLIDRKNNFWIGTDNGLALWPELSFNNGKIFNADNSILPYNEISDLLEDTKGHIWISTFRDGIVKISDGNIEEDWIGLNKDNSGLADRETLSLMEDDSGDIWIGTLNRGAHRFNGVDTFASWSSYSPPAELTITPVNLARSLEKDKKTGEILIGSYFHVACLNRNAPDSLRIEVSFVGPKAACIKEEVIFNRIMTNQASSTSHSWVINKEPDFQVRYWSSDDKEHSFGQTGLNWICMVTRTEDCYDYDCQTITIHERVDEQNLDLGADQLLCEGATTLLASNIQEEVYNYEWRKAGEIIGTTPSLQAEQAGTYILKITGLCGDINVDTIEIIKDRDCVYPGDLNKDGIVDYKDALELGLAIGLRGTKRLDASFFWQAQASAPWGMGRLADYKHLDANGDGQVDLRDQFAIELNYGKTYATTPSKVQGQSPIQLETKTKVSRSLNADSLAVVTIEIYLKDPEASAVTAYGIGFEASLFLPGVKQINQVSLDFEGSWLGIEGQDVLSIYDVHILNENSFDLETALTRIDHQNASGSGKLATVIADIEVLPTLDSLKNVIVTLDNTELTLANGLTTHIGLANKTYTFDLPISNCEGIIDECDICNGSGMPTWYYDADGDGLGDPDFPYTACEKPLGYVDNAEDNDDRIPLGSNQDVELKPNWKVYPNPVQDHLFIDLNNITQEVLKVQVHDIQGRLWRVQEVFNNHPNHSSIIFDTYDWPAGTYLLSAIIDGKYYWEKVVKY